jgi:hypothetical protein
MNNVVDCLPFDCLFLIFHPQALEDINTREQPNFYRVLIIFDKIFTVFFTVELILKWLGYGIRTYFTNGWNWLDFIIVVVGILDNALDWLGVADIPAFKSMRTLRALRPLKALSRFEGIRVILRDLLSSFVHIAPGRRQCADRCHSCDFQCAPGLSGVLADILDCRRPIVRCSFLQMCLP